MRRGRRTGLAEENDPTATGPEDPAVDLTKRARTRRSPAKRSTAVAPPKQKAPKAARTAAPQGAKRKPLRNLATVAAVAGLVATVAIPAYAAYQPTAETKTMQQVAEEGAQSLVVASKVEGAALDRGSYAATTPEEIAKKKAAEAARERARLGLVAYAGDIDLKMVGPGTGAVRWPLAKITRIGDGFRSRGGQHQGVDLISPCKTPIFASTAGVVRVSSESYFGYGVAITIDGVVGGRKVNTLYSHLTSGTRQVKVGQRVEAGQVIGLVGATGRAFGCHLHFETQISGSRVDPVAWLRSNAG